MTKKIYGTEKERQALRSCLDEGIQNGEYVLKNIKADKQLEIEMGKYIGQSENISNTFSARVSTLHEYKKFCTFLWQVIDNEQGESIHLKIKEKYNYDNKQYGRFLKGFFFVLASQGEKWAKEMYRDIFYEEVEKITKWEAAYIALLYEGLYDLWNIGHGPIQTLKFFYQTLNFPTTEDTYSNTFTHIIARAMADIPILIVGETGTSKELTARAIHTISKRRNKPFDEINCAAIPPTLLESELFGIEKGVATGVNAREGRIIEANGGILFLDEIGKIDIWLQAKLLKAIEENKIRKVGGKEDLPIDVRFISAVQPEDLKNILPDLKYRLGYPNVVQMPTLNERIADLGTEIILKCFERILGRLSIDIQKMTIDYDVIFVLLLHQYKGNYRELENILISLIISAQINQREKIIFSDLELFAEIANKTEDAVYIAKCLITLLKYLENNVLLSKEDQMTLDKYKSILLLYSIEDIAVSIKQVIKEAIIAQKELSVIKDYIKWICKAATDNLLSRHNASPEQNCIDSDINKWDCYEDYLLNDFIKGVPLKDIVSVVDDMRSMLIERKVINCLKEGNEIKSILISEGLPERSYQNYLKKIKNITGKGVNEFKKWGCPR